jgi:uncharacterized repeat protein (TIGR03806 family)
MRPTFLTSVLLAAASALIGACGEGASTPRFGLAERPLNATCRPPAAADAPPRLLSETGCVDPANPRLPAPGLIPYAVSSPLWSDGAEKERYLALPDGERIRVKDCRARPEACAPLVSGGSPQDDGHLELPVGAVLMKTFALGGRRIETRLLVRMTVHTWKGYVYEWNEAGTDAQLMEDVQGGVKKPVSRGDGTPQIWHFPSPAQCLQCHTTAAGVSLGTTLAQMNFDLAYPSGVTSNQLDTWEHIGLFESPLPLPAERPPPLPSASSAGAAVEARARAYLHVNCSNCHRPDGSFEGIDLRLGISLVGTKMCNVLPEKGDLGVTGARRLVPADPGLSLVSIRMHRLTDGRMPQIGTSVVDAAGVAAIDDWIRELRDCP